MIGFILAFVFYVLGALFFCLRHIFRDKKLAITALRLTLAAFAVHVVSLGVHLFRLGDPFILTSFETFQIISLVIISTFLIASIYYRFLSAGIFVLPLALVFFILSLTHVVLLLKTPEHFLPNPWAFTHMMFISIGMAIFLVSCATGLLYLVQESRIKSKKSGGFWDRFPSLEELDRIHYRGLYVGFIFYTVGIITGGGWSKSISGFYITHSVKQYTALAVWIFFALLLNLRVAKGWIGRKGILLSLVGFLGILFLFSWVS